MKKVSLQEYANIEKISLVTVNKRVNKGLVSSEKIGNRRYILLEEDVENNIVSTATNNEENLKLINYLERENKTLMKNNKNLSKEIFKLNKLLNKEKDNTSNIYLRYINQLENNQIVQKMEAVDIVDVKVKKKKKKK